MPSGNVALCFCLRATTTKHDLKHVRSKLESDERGEAQRRGSYVPDELRSDSDGGQMLDRQSHRSDRELEGTPRTAGLKRSRIASSTATLGGRAHKKGERSKRKGRTGEKVEGRREKKEEEKRRRVEEEMEERLSRFVVDAVVVVVEEDGEEEEGGRE